MTLKSHNIVSWKSRHSAIFCLQNFIYKISPAFLRNSVMETWLLISCVIYRFITVLCCCFPVVLLKRETQTLSPSSFSQHKVCMSSLLQIQQTRCTSSRQIYPQSQRLSSQLSIHRASLQGHPVSCAICKSSSIYLSCA